MCTLSLAEAAQVDISLIGGKAFSLAKLYTEGERVPQSLCITTEAYSEFLDQCNLREKIALELSRKEFTEMRWEEIWDTALRIRNLFVNTPLPDDLSEFISGKIATVFPEQPLAIRSSSPEEDTAKASFAGLHESYINISGRDAILNHVKKVWASLWSDAAILYRQEIGLRPEKSSMAVLVQELVDSDVSGVMFSQSPDNEKHILMEAVYGLNQGLVDGTIEPDRWYISREDLTIISHHQPVRESRIVPAQHGTSSVSLSPKLQGLAPLTSTQVTKLAEKALRLEKRFGAPQDIEWTLTGPYMYLLQSRPITTTGISGNDDKRPWYLSLRRSFANLKSLKKQISEELLPAMENEAREMAAQNFSHLNDKELAAEIRRREVIHKKWVDIYWTEFIPFAHGMRLFGQVYNDWLQPDDPYEFVSLLSRGSLASIRRNRLLQKLGDIAFSKEAIKTLLAENRAQDITDNEFAKAFQELRERFGDLHLSLGEKLQEKGPDDLLCSLILKMADKKSHEQSTTSPTVSENLEKQFLAVAQNKSEEEWAVELLELGRASYTLRDDDNIYLGRIEQQLNRAIDEARYRLQKVLKEEIPSMDIETTITCLEDPSFIPLQPVRMNKEPVSSPEKKESKIRARQLLGQPAGPGIAKGKARVVTKTHHLKEFEQNEILVCDSIDPNMTFIVPLAGGIVERRGGMLIHGAIIAREYGIACVTGIPNATNLFKTGDTLTVDGFLGIVTISHVKDPLA